MTLTRLLTRHLGTTPGPDAGTCYLCGDETDAGHRRSPSDLFTAWASCQPGDVICPHCLTAITYRPVRMRSWLVTGESFRPVTPDDRYWLWAALLDPPPPPFAFYLTRGGQKQGWITLMPCVAASRTRYHVGTDWTDRPVLMDAETTARIAPLLVVLRGRKVSKAALLSGQFSMKTYERAMDEGWERDLVAAKHWAGDPRWEALVYGCH